MRALLLAFLLLSGCYLSHQRAAVDAGPGVPTPDSGSTESDGGAIVPVADAGPSDPDAGPVVPPPGGVTVICGAYPDGTALRETTTGTESFAFYGFRVIPHGRPILLPSAQFDFGWDGRTLYGSVFGHESGRPYFTNWTLTADRPFRILNRPDYVSFYPAVEELRAVVFFNMTDWVEDGLTEDTLIRLHADIAETEEGIHALTLGRYTTYLGAISLYYADTGEVVAREDIIFEGCRFPTLAPVLVRLAEADIIVNRESGEMPETVRSDVGRVNFLHLLALNDGASDGTIDRTVFDTRVVVIPGMGGSERPASIRDAVSACYLTRGGRVLATARFEGEQVVFDHAGVVVTTDDRGTSIPDGFASFEIACDVRLNDAILPFSGALRVWVGVHNETGLRLVETPLARVRGTLMLEQNALSSLPADSTRYVQIVR